MYRFKNFAVPVSKKVAYHISVEVRDKSYGVGIFYSKGFARALFKNFPKNRHVGNLDIRLFVIRLHITWRLWPRPAFGKTLEMYDA